MVFWTICAVKIATKVGRKGRVHSNLATAPEGVPGGGASIDRKRVYRRGHQTLTLSKTKIVQFALLFKTRDLML